MPDDLSRVAPEDPTRINTQQTWEVTYWASKWGVTSDDIRAAVAAVGVSTEAVRRHLGK